MRNIFQDLALLLAGAIASIIGGLLLQPPVCNTLIWILGGVTFIFILYGSGAISKIWRRYTLWKRKMNKFISVKVGILNDMGSDLQNKEIYVWANISQETWKQEIEKWAKESKVKIKIKLINVKKNFDSYIAILNPYGGVYPENDLKNFRTLNKIFTYVSEGGLFVNIADIPGYWVYNPLLNKKLDATRPIYAIDKTSTGISVDPIRLFEHVPFMEKLGLRVLNTQSSQYFTWNGELENKFIRIMDKIDEIKVHRAVVVERNVQSIIRPKNLDLMSKITPIFLVPYGYGKFLISLIVLDGAFPENDKMKEIIAKIIIEQVKEYIKKK